ncbi:MAG: CvpA family protein, partial [Candidatus Levyibacteriota bacterium]
MYLQTLNWVDILICIVLLFYAIEGYALCVLLATIDLFKFLFSFLVGLRVYGFFASALLLLFPLPKGIASAIAFFVIAVGLELFLSFLFGKIVKKVITNSFFQEPHFIRLSNIIGIFPGVLSGTILLMFLLTIITVLPISPYLKNSVTSSVFGNMLIARSQVI